MKHRSVASGFETLTPSLSPNLRRYYSLDIVRAVAACSVALGHLQAYLPAPASVVFDRGLLICNQAIVTLLVGSGKTSAHPGVIVFVVLSGFCIHLPVARNGSRLNRVGFWREYFARRFARILPVYWWGCVLGLLAMLLTRIYGVAPTWLGGEPLETVTLLKKFLFVDPISMKDAVALGNPAIRSVATELWLYILYPAALVGVLGQSWRSQWIRIALLYAISALFLFVPPGPAWAYESVPRFLVWWLMGAAAATEVDHSFRCNDVRRYVRAFAMSLGALIAFNQTPYFRGSYLISVPLLACATASGILLMMTLEHRKRTRATRTARFIAYVGERSYSLYVVHMPLLGFLFLAERFQPWAALHARLGSAIAIVVLALGTCLTYELIEKPSHKWSRSLKGARTDREGHEEIGPVPGQ